MGSEDTSSQEQQRELNKSDKEENYVFVHIAMVSMFRGNTSDAST
jgi:hypothetical protein